MAGISSSKHRRTYVSLPSKVTVKPVLHPLATCNQARLSAMRVICVVVAGKC